MFWVKPIFAHFQYFAVLGLLKTVLFTIPSLFKSTKPYLWTLRLIAHVFKKNFMVSLIKLFVNTVKEGPLRNLTECIRHMASWIWIGYLSSLQSRKQFVNEKIFEKCAKNVCIAKSMTTFFLTVDCVSNHINDWQQVPKRKNFDFTAQTRWILSI